TLTAILLLGSRAAARFDPFSFWHIPGQRGNKSVISRQSSVVSCSEGIPLSPSPRCHSEYFTVIPSVARNLALVCGGKNQSEITRFARNDTKSRDDTGGGTTR